MELWFIAAAAAALIAGISNFFFKVAAKQGHNSELFMLVSGLCSTLLVSVTLVLFPVPLFVDLSLAALVFGFGFIAAFAGVMKVYALRHIDSTIYFPLLKLLAPALTILSGVWLFGETFTSYEWLGMMIGLFVPLMLITKTENQRQNNLVIGLLFVLVTGVISAMVATAQNFAVDSGMHILVVLFYIVFGVFCGSVASFIFKQGFSGLFSSFHRHYSHQLLSAAILRSVFAVVSVGLVNYAYSVGGTLAAVQIIYSMYILITVVMSIVFYSEHWNVQKAIAIVLSIVSLAFLS